MITTILLCRYNTWIRKHFWTFQQSDSLYLVIRPFVMETVPWRYLWRLQHGPRVAYGTMNSMSLPHDGQRRWGFFFLLVPAERRSKAPQPSPNLAQLLTTCCLKRSAWVFCAEIQVPSAHTRECHHHPCTRGPPGLRHLPIDCEPRLAPRQVMGRDRASDTMASKDHPTRLARWYVDRLDFKIRFKRMLV